MLKRYTFRARPVLLPLALTAGICVAAQDESEDHEEEQLSDSEDEKKASQVEWPSDDKAARLTQTWKAKKAKYQKYASKGKVEKLERALARQQAKLQQAIDNGKPKIFTEHKKAKCDFTTTMLRTAMLVRNLKTAGLMRRDRVKVVSALPQFAEARAAAYAAAYGVPYAGARRAETPPPAEAPADAPADAPAAA